MYAIVVRFFDEFSDLRPSFRQSAQWILGKSTPILCESRQCFLRLIRIFIQYMHRDVCICFGLVPYFLHFVLLPFHEFPPISIFKRLSADGNLSTIADPFSAQRIIPANFVRTVPTQDYSMEDPNPR